MTKLKFLIFAFLLSSTISIAQKMPPAPNPPRLVNDFVGLLSTDEREQLEAKLVANDNATSNQITVVIVNSLQDYEPVEYATKLGREWKVGNKKTNNGVIVLISTEPGRRKVFIAPGYGLEGALPDITCKQIVENEIIPLLKQNNFFGALDKGTNAIVDATKGEYKPPANYNNRNTGAGESILPFLLLVFLIIIIISIISRKGGGRNGGMMSRRGYSGYNGPSVWWFPVGGGSSSGWGGGDSGGGGFGGFGGGSFGGGGAGGDW